MHIESFRAYCLAKAGTTESLPFDEFTLVFKVMGKIFAITGLKWEEFSINLKCDPDRAIELRESHPEIQPGYHMSKKHWNTVNCEGGLTDKMLCEMIDHSYDLIVSKLKKADKELLKQMNQENA